MTEKTLSSVTGAAGAATSGVSRGSTMEVGGNGGFKCHRQRNARRTGGGMTMSRLQVIVVVVVIALLVLIVGGVMGLQAGDPQPGSESKGATERSR